MYRIRELIQPIVHEEMNTVLRELLVTQKNEINALIVQHLRQQQQPQPQQQPTVNRLASPNPSASTIIDNKQQTALKLARSGQLNQAFEYVLSASDLNLVLYLCENVRPNELFSIQPCPLQIPVVLSLIQQLAADLTTNQELKYRYFSFTFFDFLTFSLWYF